MRPQTDCTLANLEKLLPAGNHYEIKSSGSFLEDLSKADLLVSWASTTIEEALHSHKPVLLWGGSNRYFHLPPCKTLPTSQNRSAVYAPETEAELGSMVESILEHHAGKPLKSEELSTHVWPDDVSGMDEFIQQLMNKNRN